MTNTDYPLTIALCGSMKVVEEMIKCASQLNEWEIATYLPTLDEPVDYAALPSELRATTKATLIRKHVEKIRASDAVLVYNQTLEDCVNYVGANSFLEMGFAFAFGKEIYLLNDIPSQPNTDEIAGMLPVCLGGNLARIRN